MSISLEYYFASTQYIYVSGGEGTHHTELTYDPIHFNAVTCSSDYIFVAELGGVHIHTWSGEHTQRLVNDQLGLQYDRPNWIRAINYSINKRTTDHILQLVVGDSGTEALSSSHPEASPRYKPSWLGMFACLCSGDNDLDEKEKSVEGTIHSLHTCKVSDFNFMKR